MGQGGDGTWHQAWYPVPRKNVVGELSASVGENLNEAQPHPSALSSEMQHLRAVVLAALGVRGAEEEGGADHAAAKVTRVPEDTAALDMSRSIASPLIAIPHHTLQHCTTVLLETKSLSR